jgi:hypothetical protein
MKIAQGGVRYCASCYGQYVEREHVDFESTYDGPAIKQENQDYYQVGDLIICSKCLTNAGALIGLYPAEDIKKENEELGQALENKNDENIALHEAYSDLEKSFEALADNKIKRPARKPKLVESIGIANGA